MIGLGTTFNHLVITETLFPSTERARARAIARKLNPHLYLQLEQMLKTYERELRELRLYYEASFVANDFSFIRKINDIPSPVDKLLVEQEYLRLPQVVADIVADTDNITDIGLYHGLSGAMLTLAFYAQTSCDQRADEKASILLSKILSRLPKSDLPFGFSDGYAGIGWTLVFLYQNRLIEDELGEELSFIDQCISQLAPKRFYDLSFDTGLGGILAYINIRQSMAETMPSCAFFNNDFLTEMMTGCENFINLHDLDIRTQIQVAEFKDGYKNKRWDANSIHIDDILQLPIQLPKNKQYQKPGLDGRTGFALCLTLKIRTANNCGLLYNQHDTYEIEQI